MNRLMWTMVALFLAAGSLMAEENWPTWRGTGLQGMAEGNPPVKWSESKNIKWKIALPGDGSSTPVVWGRQMIFQTARAVATADKPQSGLDVAPDKREGIFKAIEDAEKIYAFDVVCVDRDNGKTLWQTTVCKAQPHEGHHRDHGYASFSPVTDGRKVWVNFGSRGVYCLDMAGKVLWQKEMPKMKTRASFGEGSSPAIAGDKLVVLADHEGQSEVYAFDKETGKLAWKQDRDEGTLWTTPVTVEVGGKLQVIAAGSTATRCYEPDTGKLVWHASGLTPNTVPTPLVGFGMVYVMSGFRGNMLQAIKLGRTGDLTGTDGIAWSIDKDTSYVPSAALSNGMIFYCVKNSGKLCCVDARTGKVHYESQAIEGVKKVYASIVAVQDRLYIADREGAVGVVKASPKFEVLAVNQLDDGFDASPVILGDRLYLKGRKSLYCIEQ